MLGFGFGTRWNAENARSIAIAARTIVAKNTPKMYSIIRMP
jgi:hypothetical protein